MLETPSSQSGSELPLRESRPAISHGSFKLSRDDLGEFARHPTIDTLRNVMGDEKANGLITNIGLSVLRTAPAGMNLSLGAIVTQTLARLTQQELASIAKGDTSALGRAQAFAEDQVKAMQSNEPAQNMYGARQPADDGKGPFAGQGRFAVIGNKAGRGDDSNSGARYDGMGSIGDWNSPAGQAQMRELAVKSGIGWAAHNPGLLRMGPSAIQALAESHLKEENYKTLKNRLDFSDKDVVAGAKYSNRNHVDYNDITTSTNKAADGLPAAERKELLGGVKQLFNGKPGQEGQCKADFNTKVEGIKKSHPEKTQELDHLQKSLGTQKKAEVTQEHKEMTATGEIGKKAAVAEAMETQAKNDVANKQVTKSKLLASLD
jgi:hypothetical protein